MESPMTIRWQFLSEEEKKKLEEYDMKMSALIGKSGEGEVQEIDQLHKRMDCFILELQEKYCPTNCSCRNH
jgi:hypothetical protein